MACSAGCALHRPRLQTPARDAAATPPKAKAAHRKDAEGRDVFTQDVADGRVPSHIDDQPDGGYSSQLVACHRAHPGDGAPLLTDVECPARPGHGHCMSFPIPRQMDAHPGANS